jgi:Mg2+ and Co2+ transporter CorA
LEAKDANLKTIFSYSSIMLLKEVIGSVWAMNFKPWIW